MSLAGKIIVITGGSSGIGKALAELSLQQGAYVAVCARDMEKLHAAFSDKPEVFKYQADVSKEDDCKKFIQAVIGWKGGIDVLINNAGMSMRALLHENSVSVLQRLMDVNFWGTVWCTTYALESIKARKGVIVGVSSIAGYRGLPARTGYSASKFAMQGFLEALRTELLQTGTHVMWVCPGFTASNIRNTALGPGGIAQGETPLQEEKLMSAETCAQIILNAVSRRKRTVVMTLQGKLTVWINKLFPSLADKLVFNHFAKEPGSPLANT